MRQMDNIIRELVQAEVRSEMREVEKLILAGNNEVTIISSSGQKHVYLVPKWSRQPIKRFRVEWARRKFRAPGEEA